MIAPAMTAMILDDPHFNTDQGTVSRLPPLLRSIKVQPPDELPRVTQDDVTERGALSNSSAITDFSRTAHDVAEAITNRGDSKPLRPLDRHTQVAPENTREPSIFGPLEHAANSTEHFDDGSDRVFVGGNCFYDFDRQPPPPADLIAGPKLKVPTCKPPAGSGSHDMFKALTPTALKSQPGSRQP